MAVADKYKPTNLKKCSYMEIHKGMFTKLNNCLFLPSRIESYSMVVDFVHQWIMSISDKYKKNFWNAISLEGRNPLADIKMNHWTVKEFLKRSPPRISINGEVDLSFNNDNLNDDFGSLSVWFNTGHKDKCFFKDKKRNVYIGLVSRLNMVSFKISIELRNQAEQHDLYDYLYRALRVNKTLTLYPAMDFYIPRVMLKQIASDLAFEFDKDGNIKDEIAFMNYLNSNSQLPFVNKFRGLTRRSEYYVRFPEWMVNIRDIAMSHDNGEKVDMLTSNYHIDLEFNVRFPSPKFYFYESKADFEKMMYRDVTDNNEIKVADLNLSPVSDTNERGWSLYLEGDYRQDEINVPLVVNLNDMFYNPNGNENDILEVVAFCKDQVTDPAIFLDIKVYMNNKLLDTRIDWTTNTLISKYSISSHVCKICVYLDHLYMNNVLIYLRGDDVSITSRINNIESQFQP